MQKNYFIIVYRNLIKHKFYSSINLLGLAIGTAACLLIMHYVRYELSYEDFHENANQIYRVTLDIYEEGELLVQDAETYPLLGPQLKEEMPEVLEFVRLHDKKHVVIGTDAFRQTESRLYFSDPSVFSVFSLHLLQGNAATALNEPFSLVLTESKARQYFGTTDVLGKTLDLYGLSDRKLQAKITGVIQDLSPNTHLKIDFLISFISLQDKSISYPLGWNGNNEFTYLLMAPGTHLEAFNQKLHTFSEVLYEKIGEERFVAQPIKDIHLYSRKTYEPEANGDAETVYFLLIIAFLILGIAWVNYVNLATARSIERAKEVGVKKALGCSRSRLIGQFLFESLVMNVAAILLALLLVYVSFEAFRNISGHPITFNLLGDIGLWFIITGLLLTGTLLSGLYPALVLSSFRPVSVMKGKLPSRTHGLWLRQGLVVFQFMASVVLMVGTFTVYQQLNYLQEQDLGVDTDQILVAEMPLDILHDSLLNDKITVLKTAWKTIPTVEKVAGTGVVPGSGYNLLNSSTGVRRVGSGNEGSAFTYYHFGIDEDLIAVLGLELIAGQNFQAGMDNRRKIIINEEAVHLLGFENPESAIGEKITFDSASIIGVVKNYHHHSPKEPFVPLIFWYSHQQIYQCIRLSADNIQNTVSNLEATFQQVFPGSTFSYFFLDDAYNQQYKADVRFGQVFSLFAGLAMLIACMGLLGLSSYTCIQRTKEIGIRKTLGASIWQIILLLTRSYSKLIIIALLIAIPVANYLMTEWLQGFAYRITMHWWLFMVPGIAILLIALLSVIGQTFKAARQNPVDSLRYE